MGGSPFQLTDLHPGHLQMLPCGEAAGLRGRRACCVTLRVARGLCHGAWPHTELFPCTAFDEQCARVVGIQLCLLQGLIVEISWICMSVGGKPYMLPVAM